MRGNEKREKEYRKKVEKEAMDKAKKEEEVRDAKRTARKLNFLITQTELYSHFVGNKIKSRSQSSLSIKTTSANPTCFVPFLASEAEDSADTAGAAAPKAAVAPPQQSDSLRAAIEAEDAPEGAELKALDFDIGKSIYYPLLISRSTDYEPLS